MNDISMPTLLMCSLLGFFCPDPPILDYLDSKATLRDCTQRNGKKITLAMQHTAQGNFAAWGVGFFSDQKTTDSSPAQYSAVFWQKQPYSYWAWETISSDNWREWEIISFDEKQQLITRETLAARSPDEYAQYQRDIAQIPREYRKNSDEKQRHQEEFPSTIRQEIPDSWQIYSFVTEQASCTQPLTKEGYVETFKRDFSLY